MKNKNILLKDLLAQREAEVMLEALSAKELGKKVIDKLPDVEQRKKAKQQAAKAIRAIVAKQKEIRTKVEQSPAFQKAQEELAKELKDPKKTKAAISTLIKASDKILKTLASPITDKEKRKVLDSILNSVQPIALVGVIYNIIEAILEVEINIPLVGSIGTGLDIPDMPFLDVFASALPLIAAIRLVLFYYRLKAAGQSVRKGVSNLFKGRKKKDTPETPQTSAVDDPFAKFRNLDENEVNLRLITADDEQALLSLFNTPE
jgi:hypothetical protein